MIPVPVSIQAQANGNGKEAFGLNAFETLGLNSTADLEAVKAAYHALVKQWHPDQFTDEGMQQKAQQKLIELNLYPDLYCAQ